jgi:hypothetical protein
MLQRGAPPAEFRAPIQQLINDQGRFARAVEAAAANRRDIADNAEMIASMTVGVALGVGLTRLAAQGLLTGHKVVSASNAVGLTSVGTRAAILGNAYTPEEAVQNYLLTVGLEAAFTGVALRAALRGAGGVGAHAGNRAVDPDSLAAPQVVHSLQAGVVE